MGASLPADRYLPPWRRVRPDGTLGACYGPRTQAGYDRALAQWQFSIWGGGLWDFAEDAKGPSSPRPVQTCVPTARPDGRSLGTWIRDREKTLPKLQVEVYLELYEAGSTLREAGQRLGVAREHIVRAHRRLLDRYERYLNHCRG